MVVGRGSLEDMPVRLSGRLTVKKLVFQGTRFPLPWEGGTYPKHSMGLPYVPISWASFGVNAGIYGSPMGRVWNIAREPGTSRIRGVRTVNGATVSCNDRADCLMSTATTEKPIGDALP